MDKRLSEALATEPVLSDEQSKQLAGYGSILPAEEVFKLGWREALSHVRKELAKG